LIKNAEGETGLRCWSAAARPHAVYRENHQAVRPRPRHPQYVEAILRVYNQYGRRDNIYKARIKILVHELGIEKIREGSRGGVQQMRDGALTLESAWSRNPFALLLSCLRKAAAYAGRAEEGGTRPAVRAVAPEFGVSAQGTGLRHRTVSLKPVGGRPAMPPPTRWTRWPISPTVYRSVKSASATSRTWCCRTSQNATCLFCEGARQARLATPNVNLVSDIIACPGLDYCSLANARSIPIAQELDAAFRQPRHRQSDRPAAHQHFRLHQCLRPSPCRPHRHSRRREERRGIYQITIGGRADENAQMGTLIGPAVPYAEVADVIEDIVEAYLALRDSEGELFVDTVKRLASNHSKERVYATR